VHMCNKIFFFYCSSIALMWTPLNGWAADQSWWWWGGGCRRQRRHWWCQWLYWWSKHSFNQDCWFLATRQKCD